MASHPTVVRQKICTRRTNRVTSFVLPPHDGIWTRVNPARRQALGQRLSYRGIGPTQHARWGKISFGGLLCGVAQPRQPNRITNNTLKCWTAVSCAPLCCVASVPRHAMPSSLDVLIGPDTLSQSPRKTSVHLGIYSLDSSKTATAMVYSTNQLLFAGFGQIIRDNCRHLRCYTCNDQYSLFIYIHSNTAQTRGGGLPWCPCRRNGTMAWKGRFCTLLHAMCTCCESCLPRTLPDNALPPQCTPRLCSAALTARLAYTLCDSPTEQGKLRDWKCMIKTLLSVHWPWQPFPPPTSCWNQAMPRVSHGA